MYVLQAADRVEKTKSIEAIVKLFDTNNKLLKLNAENLGIYQLKEEILDSNLLSVKLGHQENLKEGEIRYIVTGVELGETKIVVSRTLDGMRIASSPATIQVNCLKENFI